jgi:CheY-like chemotaxis protein
MEQQNKRILIVDDDAEQLFIARELLSREGYEVLTHRSPFGVVGLICTANPDLVLVDLAMPALPGDDLAAFLRADDRTRSVPIVLYSSTDESRLRSAVVHHRLRGYILKGDVSDLRRKVGYFLQEHESDGAAYRQRLYALD